MSVPETETELHSYWIKCNYAFPYEFVRDLAKKLSQQSTHLAEALKEKNDAVEDSYKRANAIEIQGREIVKLKDELKLWRPPEPKFKVGQVVIYNLPNNLTQSFTIRYIKLQDKRWLYANARMIHNASWQGEDKFRKLTTEEIG